MEYREGNMESVYKQMMNLRKIYGKACFKALSRYDFSPCEIDILIFLSNNETLNTAKELVFYMHVSKALIARSVESLEKRGLIEIKEDDFDKRVKRLLLTNKSNEIVEEIKKEKIIFLDIITENISHEELDVFMSTLHKISDNVEKIMEERNENKQ